MRPILALAAATLAGCVTVDFDTTTANWIAQRRHSAYIPIGPPLRSRAVVDIESEWLSGTFEAVVLAVRGMDPSLRAQFFPDVGGKAIDMAVRPNRIVGYFPYQREGIDCLLPDEAAAHPLLFMGVTILEHFNPWILDRVKRVREAPGGWEVHVASFIPGCTLELLMDEHNTVLRRRFRWTRGAAWDMERISDKEYRITAPRLRIAVRVREEGPLQDPPAGGLSLSLPADVRIVQGSRK